MAPASMGWRLRQWHLLDDGGRGESRCHELGEDLEHPVDGGGGFHPRSSQLDSLSDLCHSCSILPVIDWSVVLGCEALLLQPSSWKPVC
jgi:hypothetical protein